jgi:hypothetical protein
MKEEVVKTQIVNVENEKDDGKIFYSHSKLWLYESCPEAYKIKYIDKTFPELPKGIELFLGEAAHAALEWFYNRIKLGIVEELDELVNYYAGYWKEKFNLFDFRISNGGTPDDYFDKGVRFLVNYYFKNKPFDDKTLFTEKKIIFPINESKKYWIQGYVDRITIDNDGIYHIHDYKTNQYQKTQAEIDADRQLAFYHLGLKEIFGSEVKVRLVWHFLAHNVSVFSSRTDEELEKLKKNTFELINKIENNNEWWACRSKWCDWCNFKKENGGNAVITQNPLDKMKDFSLKGFLRS